MFAFWNFIIVPNIYSWASLILFLSAIVFAIWYNRKFHTYLRSDDTISFGWLWNGLASILLIAIGASFFTLLSEPIWKSSHEKISVSGNSIVFTLDLSKSMLAEDMQPSRIEAAKKILAGFVREGNIKEMGLVVFAGEAFTAVPITQDRDSFLSTLENITPNSINQDIPWLSGTSIGNALLLSRDLLDRNSGSGATWKISPVIILLTDGEANTGIDPLPVAKSMSGAGIPVYTIGIGSEAGTDLYITDRNGVKRYFMGEDGKPIRAILDEPLMNFIASATGGEYFRASDVNSLADIFKSLAKLSDGKQETLTVESEKPLEIYFAYAIFAFCAILLLVRWKIGEASFF